MEYYGEGEYNVERARKVEGVLRAPDVMLAQAMRPAYGELSGRAAGPPRSMTTVRADMLKRLERK